MTSRISAVLVHPDFVNLPQIKKALEFVAYFSRYKKLTPQEVLERWTKSGTALLWARVTEADHLFGSTLIIDGDRHTIEFIVPWHQVLGIVSDKTGALGKAIGFQA